MNTQTQGVQQVPLIQLLRRVPENAKLIVDSADGMGSTFHPVGRLCHEAAEALAQPAQEPVLNVVKILNEFPLLDDEGLDEDKHHCEWTLQQDRKRLHAMLKTHPAPHPAQEPVAWIEVTTHHEKYQTSKVILLDKGIKLPHDTLLYTHPAPSCQECENLKHDLEGYMDANKALINREWQGLSDDEKKSLHKEHRLYIPTIEKIDAMLKKKNT